MLEPDVPLAPARGQKWPKQPKFLSKFLALLRWIAQAPKSVAAGSFRARVTDGTPVATTAFSRPTACNRLLYLGFAPYPKLPLAHPGDVPYSRAVDRQGRTWISRLEKALAPDASDSVHGTLQDLISVGTNVRRFRSPIDVLKPSEIVELGERLDDLGNYSSAPGLDSRIQHPQYQNRLARRR